MTNRIWNIVTVNLLALLALPLLLLSIVAKLLAKALEKALLLLGVGVALLGLSLLSLILKNPGATFEGLGYFLAVLVLFGGIIAIVGAVLALFSTVAVTIVATVTGVLIGILDGLFDLCHSAYARLYDRCCKLQQSTGEQAASPWCYPLWLLLKGINFAVIKVLSVALPIAIACSVGVAIWSVWSVQSTVSRQFGLNMFSYLAMFPFLDTLFAVLYFLVVVGAAVVIFLSLGAEWNEWGAVLQVSTQDYDAYVQRLRTQADALGSNDMQVTGKEGEKGLEQCAQYMERLNDMLEGAPDLQEQADLAMELQQDTAVRMDMAEYLGVLTEITEQMNKFPKGIAVNQFSRVFVSQIDKADKLNKAIVKAVLRIVGREAKGRGKTGADMDFFVGCTTKQELERRHRALSKAYHPDVGGHEDTFKLMQNQYEALLQTMPDPQ